MRKEFKFVRGLYTKKKLFDADIINDSFVILDEKGVEVSFDAEDDSKTQSQLINASSDGRVRKVYTITPDKITMKGDLVKGDPSSYKFTPTVNENVVDDGELIPTNVRTTSEKILEEKLEADYSALTTENIGIGENSIPNSVEVTFTDKNESGKSFKRRMVFRATGDVDRSSLESVGDVTGASLKNEEVYYFENSEYKRLTNINDNDVFHNGVRQELVDGIVKTFPAEVLKLTIESDEVKVSGVSHIYEAPDGYRFNYTNDSRLSVQDIIDSGYPTFPLSPINTSRTNLVFTPPSGENCIFISDAYANTDKYIITPNGRLTKLSGDNYSYGKQETIYYNGYYYVYNNSAYKDSSTDTKKYLKLSDPKSEPISETTIGMTDIHTPTSIIDLSKEGYTIAIKEDTFKITATEV